MCLSRRVGSGICPRRAHSTALELSYRLAQGHHTCRFLGLLTHQAMQTHRQWGLAWCRLLYWAATSPPCTKCQARVLFHSMVYIKVDIRVLELIYTRYSSTPRSFSTQQGSIWRTGTGFPYPHSLCPNDCSSCHTFSDHGSCNQDQAGALNCHVDFLLLDSNNHAS